MAKIPRSQPLEKLVNLPTEVGKLTNFSKVGENAANH